MQSMRKDTMNEDMYRAYAVPYSEPGSSINYEITIQDPGGVIGATQAETAADVELMVRDWLDAMGRDGDAPLEIRWPHSRHEDGHRHNGATTA